MRSTRSGPCGRAAAGAKTEYEVSGGLTVDRARAYAEAGVTQVFSSLQNETKQFTFNVSGTTSKQISGTIWFFTLGLLGIGWLIDLFLIPGMDRRADVRESLFIRTALETEANA